MGDSTIRDTETRTIPRTEITTTHRELAPGTHLLITRRSREYEQGDERMDTNTHIKVTFAGVTEKDAQAALGKDAWGARHFMEHCAIICFGSRETNRLAETVRNITLRGIRTNGRTDTNQVSFEILIPKTEDPAHLRNFLRMLTGREYFGSDEQIMEAMDLEARPIMAEMRELWRARGLRHFIAEHIYTPDSVARQPSPGGTIDTLKTHTPSTIRDVLELVTGKATMIVQIDDPPETLTDGDLASQIIVKERDTLPEEGFPDRNCYLADRGWVHIEHPYADLGGVGTTIAIPLELQTVKEYQTWDILASIIASQLHWAVRYENDDLFVYSHTFGHNVQNQDIQISSFLDPEQVAAFYLRIAQYFTSQIIEQDLAEGFAYYKKSKVNRIKATVNNAESAASDLIRDGRYTTMSEVAAATESVELQDVLHMLEKIRTGLHNGGKLLTVIRNNQPQLSQEIAAQQEILAELCPSIGTFPPS